MKLKRCYIENFGTIHDFSYDFKDGLNTICEENGWGKTTFAVFVKAMFYGMEYAPRKKTADNDRMKYFPWQGGNFGGTIEFTVGKKEYKLERYFGKRDKEDSFALYDGKTGLPSQDYTQNIGEEIFQIDEMSYARSTYIPQNGIEISVTDSISAKLSNLIENGNDINNYESAYAKLEEHLREYKKTGGRGKIAQLKEKISLKEEEIEKCKNKYNGMLLIEEQIAEQKRQRDKLEEKRESVREAILKAGDRKELAAKQESYRILKGQEQEIEEKKRQYDLIFANGAPQDALLQTMADMLAKLGALTDAQKTAHLSEEEEARLRELELVFENGCPESPQIEMYLGESRAAEDIRNEKIRLTAGLDALEVQKEQEKEQIALERQRKNEEMQAAVKASKEKTFLIQKVLLTIGILVLAGGVSLFFLNWIAGAVCAGVAVALIIAAATRRPKVSSVQPDGEGDERERMEFISDKMEQLASDLEKVEEEYAKMREHYDAFVSQFTRLDISESPVQVLLEIKAKAEEYRLLLERNRERMEQGEQVKRQVGEVTELLRKAFASVHDKYLAYEDFHAAYEALSEDRKEYARLSEELQESRVRTQAFEESNQDIHLDEAYDGGSGASLEELQQQEAYWENEIELVNQKIHSYRKDMDLLSVDADLQPDLEDELECLRERLAEAEYKAGVLEKTMQYLKEAKESFSTHYMGTMRRGFEKYASFIGGAKGERIRLDVQLNAQIEAGAALRGSEYFSAGNRDFIGICIRLALIEALFGDEKPFVILDDPFVNLDDAKIDNAKKLLKKLADEYQILYLVCHSSRIG